MDVYRARVVFPFLSAILLTGTGCYFLALRKSRRKAISKGHMELERIRRRYGGRVIKVSKLEDIPGNNLKVEVKSFKELVKIADERERPILQVDSEKHQNFNLVQFYIIDEETLYFYKIISIMG